jgi:hypothetical protein
MDGELRRRLSEDQPPTMGVDERPAQDISEEGAVRLRVTAVDNRMDSRDHRVMVGILPGVTSSFNDFGAAMPTFPITTGQSRPACDRAAR